MTESKESILDNEDEFIPHPALKELDNAEFCMSWRLEANLFHHLAIKHKSNGNTLYVRKIRNIGQGGQGHVILAKCYGININNSTMFQFEIAGKKRLKTLNDLSHPFIIHPLFSHKININNHCLLFMALPYILRRNIENKVISN